MIRAAGVQPSTKLADHLDPCPQDPLTFEQTDINGREVMVVAFRCDGRAKHVRAWGESAMRARGSDAQSALALLWAQSCRHLDVDALVGTDLVGLLRQPTSEEDD